MAPEGYLLPALLALCWAVLTPADASLDCVGRTDGFYAHPTDCHKFYRCVSGRFYLFNCSGGLMFNSILNVCDWSRNVKCQGNGVRPSSPTGDASTTNKQTETTTLKPTDSQPTTAAATTRRPTTATRRPTTVTRRPPTTQSTASTPTTTKRSTATTITQRPATTITQRPATTITQRPATTITRRPATTITRRPSTSQRPTAAPTTPSANNTQQEACGRRVCYYTNWAQYRQGAGKFLPENVDPFLCSHVVYSFAKLVNNRLAPYEWNDESTDWSKGMYERVNDLKKINPQLKTLLALGGWNMGTAPFTAMVATAQTRQDFADQSLSYLKSRGFDGLDLDWEYPGNRGSPAEDKEKFTLLVKQLRQTYDADAKKLGGSPLLLTAAVAAGKATVDKAYEVREISELLDFINLMSYDLHGSWETVTGHHSALYSQPGETEPASYLNVDYAARLWVRLGCPPSKLVIGIPTYARTFTLTSASASALGDPARGGGNSGQYTREKGFLAYYEVCTMRGNDANMKRTQYEPYLSLDTQWAGYEDIDSVRQKVRYVKNKGFGGVMTWALDLDDFSGTFCGEGRYPLWSAVNAECGA